MNSGMYGDFRDICRRNGWKCTAQRLAVYNGIYENYTHPDVDDIWAQVKQNLPTVTRESIYRILNEFADCGIISRLDHMVGARYDFQTEPHGHFICEKCGNISDFVIAPEMDIAAIPLPGESRHIEVRITGICDKCK